MICFDRNLNDKDILIVPNSVSIEIYICMQFRKSIVVTLGST